MGTIRNDSFCFEHIADVQLIRNSMFKTILRLNKSGSGCEDGNITYSAEPLSLLREGFRVTNLKGTKFNGMSFFFKSGWEFSTF